MAEGMRVPDGDQHAARLRVDLLQCERPRRNDLQRVAFIRRLRRQAPCRARKDGRHAGEREARSDRRRVAAQHQGEPRGRHDHADPDEANRPLVFADLQIPGHSERRLGARASQPEQDHDLEQQCPDQACGVGMCQPLHVTGAQQQGHGSSAGGRVDGLGECAQPPVRNRERLRNAPLLPQLRQHPLTAGDAGASRLAEQQRPARDDAERAERAKQPGARQVVEHAEERNVGPHMLLIGRQQPDEQESGTHRDEAAVNQQDHERPANPANAWRLELARRPREAVAAAHGWQRMSKGEQERQQDREGAALQGPWGNSPEHRESPHRRRRRMREHDDQRATHHDNERGDGNPAFGRPPGSRR